MTYGSCQRMWLSNVHTWVNPYASARRARSRTRADGGVVCSTRPSFIASLADARSASRPAPGGASGRSDHPRSRVRGPNLQALGSHACYGSSSIRRKTEIDLAGVRVGPAGRDDLAARVEVDALRPVHVRVAEQA